MTTETLPDITRFLDDLARQDLAARTVAAYRTDLAAFARWFPDTAEEPFSARAVTPTDLRDYKSYLRTVESRQAATINRRFAALRAFFRWAKGAGLIRELPAADVKGVPTAPRSPKELAKRDVDRLIRGAERHGKPRNLAILQLLRHTGIRVGELCNLRLGDVTISERRGTGRCWCMPARGTRTARCPSTGRSSATSQSGRRWMTTSSSSASAASRSSRRRCN